MLTAADRLVIQHCYDEGILPRSLSLHFKRTPQHIRNIVRLGKQFPDTNAEIYFEIGVRAERTAQILQCPSTSHRQNMGTQTLSMDETFSVAPTMTNLTRSSLIKRQQVKDTQRQRAERLKTTLEKVRETSCEVLEEEGVADQGSVDEQLADLDVSLKILQNFGNNLGRDRRGWRFSSEVVDFAYIISRHSMAAYNMIRTVLPVPSRQTLAAKYGEAEKMLMKMYDRDELCHALISRYFDRTPMTSQNSEMQCTLAIDAFSINVFKKHVKEIREVSEKLGTDDGQQKKLKEQRCFCHLHRVGLPQRKSFERLSTKFGSVIGGKLHACPITTHSKCSLQGFSDN